MIRDSEILKLTNKWTTLDEMKTEMGLDFQKTRILRMRVARLVSKGVLDFKVENDKWLIKRKS